ncbi:MAG TPA: hypothetical protein VFB45_17970 [Pseudolabrys sp.]|nr:hypothetical protein [Pseudolabrys sp.]
MHKLDYALFVLGIAMTLAGSVALCLQAYQLHHAYAAVIVDKSPPPRPLLASGDNFAPICCSCEQGRERR